MDKKTVNDLRAHLATFQRGYPVLKGFVARMLSQDCQVSDVVVEVVAIVQAAVPEKLFNKASIRKNVYVLKKFLKERRNLTQQWSSLTELFLQPFPVTFETLPVLAATSQPGHTSPAQHPEPMPVPQHPEPVPVPQHPEPVPVPQHPEPVPVPQHPEPMPVPQQPVPMPVPQHLEPMPVPQHPEPMPVPQHPEPMPVPLSVTPLEPNTQQTTLAQSLAPLSVTPLEQYLIMEKKTVHDLRAHLSSFQPGYPILKGYIARLLSHDLPVSEVVAEVLAIVQAAVPEKLCNKKNIRANVNALKKFLKEPRNLTQQWSSLTKLFLQPFPVKFETLPVLAATSQPGHTSPAQHPEPVPVPQHPEPVPVPQHPEPMPVPQQPVPMPVPQHLEPMPVPQHPEPMPVPQHPEPMPVPQHSEPMPVPLSVTPLELGLIMEKKTVRDLRAHLSSFQPGYPILKGYVARLLSHDLPVSDVVAEVLAIVQAAVPEKQCNEGSIETNVYVLKRFMKGARNLTQQWSSVTEFFLQPFRFTFKSPPMAPVSSQPDCPSSPSPSRHPEPPTSPTSEMLPQTVTSALMQPMQNSITINSSTFSTTSKLPFSRKLRRDCANCVTKQRTNMNMLQKNKRLHQKLKEFKMHFMEENGNFSMKRFNENIKRKNQQITKWKGKYISLKTACRDTHKLLKCLESLQQQVKTLEVRLSTAQEENMNMTSVNEWLNSMLEKTQIDYANVKQESIELKRMLEKTENAKTHFEQVHEQLRSILEKAENNDAHFKQLCGQLKSVLETTEKDDSCLNWQRQASHSPEMEIKEELPCEVADNHGGDLELQCDEIMQENITEEHPERWWWKGTSVSDETTISQDIISNVSTKDMLHGERCQVKTGSVCLEHGPSVYIDYAEVPCEHISNEDMNETVTAEKKVEVYLFRENEAAISDTQLCYANSDVEHKENGLHQTTCRTKDRQLLKNKLFV